MIIKKEELLGLNKVLGLDYKGYEQDWALEFADSKRVSDFIQILSTKQLTNPEKHAVLSLILSSFDDFLNEKNTNALWDEITALIDSNIPVYIDLLSYWAVLNEDKEENWFAITPFVRSYLKRKHLLG